MYVFIDPKVNANETNKQEIDWEYAQKEIAEAKGFTTRNVQLTQGIISNNILVIF